MALPTNMLHMLRARTKPSDGFVAVNNFFAVLKRMFFNLQMQENQNC